ncbi:MAG TPA: hypothetical protein VE088_08650 [Gaiellaceae bacterium]|jgi:alkylhydroperoxidase family enzyme|nr:hypothetical protein [Gaiellaceae bacterium]
MGFVEMPESGAPNFERGFGLRPDVYRAWQGLNETIKAHADLRRHEVATLAAAKRLRSSYCALAHGKVLAEQFYDPDAIAAFPEGLPPEDRAVVAFAERIVDDAFSITQADVDELRGHGLTDEDIVNVVLAVTARCFFSKTLDALGVEPDASFAELPTALREALTVGRPIEQQPHQHLS